MQKQLPQGYLAFPKMRIADILRIRDGAGYYKRRNQILPKHVDFIVCNPDFKPVVAIEVNGSSHRNNNRIKSDEVKKKVFSDAGLPLVSVQVGSDFNQAIQEIVKSIN